MNTTKDLTKSPTYHLTKIRNQVSGLLQNYINKDPINGPKLCKDLGISNDELSKLINEGIGDSLSDLKKLLLAMGKVPVIMFLNIDEDRSHEKYSDYYTKKKEAGLVKPKEYNIPPLDTIGKRKHEMLKENN